MSEPISTDSISEVLLANGCSERQIAAMRNVLDTTEKELTGLHLQIVALRALACCGRDATDTLNKYAETVLWTSNNLLDALRKQTASLGRIVGQH